jgi:hypothetical protein
MRTSAGRTGQGVRRGKTDRARVIDRAGIRVPTQTAPDVAVRPTSGIRGVVFKAVKIGTLAFVSILLAATVSAAGVRRRAVGPIATPPLDWKVETITEGGIAGVGVGGVTVSSDGAVGILFAPDQTPRCTFQLDALSLQSLNTLVAQARPRDWVASYVPASLNARCCDLIDTKLRLSVRDGSRVDVFETEWLFPVPTFPFDLAQIANALCCDASSLRSRFAPLCRNTP